MNHKHNFEESLGNVHGSVDTTNGRRMKKILSFFGPAYLVSVGYMDPGNWATDLAGGSQFGYRLIWVLLMSNLMALLLQSMSARLGIVRGRDLAQANRETYPKAVNFTLYILAEIAIAATDLAEVLGMAIGIQLLTGIPLIYAVLITVFDTFLLLLLQGLGMRKMEAFVIGLVAVIGGSFAIEMFLAKPDVGEIAKGFIPGKLGPQALYIAVGIIGATVMPHNLYLHSALVQTRKIKRDDEGIRRALKFNTIDSAIALNLAFLVNAAILILSAAAFYTTGRTDVAEIKQAYELLPSQLGTGVASTLFAVALIAAGQSSTITGTLAGQIVMEGYLRIRINPWLRRLITRVIAIVPAVIVILVNGEEDVDSLLVLSQVILSLQLGFAIIPLIHFVSDKKSMGKFAIKTVTKIAAWLITSILIYLNKMVIDETVAFFSEGGHWLWKIVIVVVALGLLAILLITFFTPLIRKRKASRPIELHPAPEELKAIEAPPSFLKIAVALEFGRNDRKLISFALGQGNAATEYTLIHVVESASAKMLGVNADDFESRTDQQQLDHYLEKLRDRGVKANGHLGYNRRSEEIARIVKESGCDLLVIGAHGHRGIKDFLYGHTIDAVRHAIKIPVLVVSV